MKGGGHLVETSRYPPTTFYKIKGSIIIEFLFEGNDGTVAIARVGEYQF